LKRIERNKVAVVRAATIGLLALLVACPFAIHTAIISGHSVAALLMLLAPAVLLTCRSPAGRLLASLAGAAVVVLLAAAIEGSGQFLLYLMPVLINTTLAILFGRTLLPGRTPIITRFSILLRGKLEPRVLGYTRRVTQLWTLFFLILALVSLLLALLAPLHIWSLFANILNYLFVLLLFVGEYLFRIHYLADLEHPGFRQFVSNLFRVNPRAFNEQ
jgi:uncharacterized membrane protein